MDSDQGKLFIGGISWETTEDKLKDYFSQYGDVLQTVVMRDKATGKPRGFGFVAFSDPSILERVLQETHTIDGRTVEAKKAMSREEQHTSVRSGNNMMRNTGGGGGSGSIRTKKIFVGGLPPTLSDMEFRKYFEAFGSVTDVVVMYDPNTQRPRGFGFVSFDSEDSVDRVVQKQFHDVGGKAVEVKRALPKDANPSNATNRSMGGGSYQSYGSSGANSNSYDNRVDGSRYVQPPASGAGYNPYGSSSYGAPAYGYGTATNGVGYGGYGSYGNAGAYGNPGGPAAGYVSGPPGAPRSGYVSAGYGANAGYGATGSWNNAPGSGGPVSGHTGQSPGTVAGYGNQGYGYGAYGASEGPYGNQGGYGGVGGHGGGNPSSGGEQGAGTGFTSGGYSDNSGYSNTWRSDPVQVGGYGAGQMTGAPGGTVGYTGGYASSQSRQGQQQ